jgi:effector-binding domain-containing protein
MATNTPAQPSVVTRDAQPYVAIRRAVTMQTIPEIADRLPDVFGWLAQRGIAPAGAPFLKYNVIDMDRELEIEAGVPVASPVAGAPPAGGPARGDQVLAGTLPAGRYAVATHVGHPRGLVEAVRRLLDWAAAQGLEWDMSPVPAGERWGCRLEVYKTEPSVDMNDWETDLVFRLAD